MTPSAALIDSNVIVAALASDHQHFTSSAALINAAVAGHYAIAAHSYAEAYNHLTRQGPRGSAQLAPGEAWMALQHVAALTVLVGLTPEQTLAAVGRYAARSGIGARLYDHLIGETALTRGIRQIVTWNVSHFRGLFPQLDIITPAET